MHRGKVKVITGDEFNHLRLQIVTSNQRGGRRYLPYAFTEQCIAMLSAGLRSETAIKVSIRIITAFVAMRRFIAANAQIFEGYKFVADLIRTAQKIITIIDNYIADSVLTFLTKRRKNVRVILLTKYVSNQMALDVKKYNEQYPAIEIKEFMNSHDRFINIDNTTVYHFGASLKDLGKKWFAFSKMDFGAVEMLTRLKEMKVDG
ncbi:MAG: ORF6N domain-containing protein [Halobacteriota archaeon]